MRRSPEEILAVDGTRRYGFRVRESEVSEGLGRRILGLQANRCRRLAIND